MIQTYRAAARLLLRDAFILNFVTQNAPVNADVASWGPRRIAGIVANMQAYLDTPTRVVSAPDAPSGNIGVGDVLLRVRL
ncbi:hypothetical protein [Streptomyces sp. NPDC004533]|uniref:hypothetical protein n=1 Tax=Streptomyces sp. NPDC004533 TaxID=3154278 RepID=UPI0033A5A89C